MDIKIEKSTEQYLNDCECQVMGYDAVGDALETLSWTG